MDTLPEISIGTAALAIFAICAGYMFIRGLLRTVVNTVTLVVSAWVGFRVWQQAPALALEWTKTTSPILTTGLPILAGLITLLVLRKIIRFFRAPVPPSAEDAAPKSSGQLIFRLLITLVPAGLLCLTAATFLHHASSVAEISEAAGKSSPLGNADGLAERIKSSLSSAIPSALMDWLDPLTTRSRLDLAKMIVANADKPLKPVIDPETGQPFPRAIIVDDPELQELAKEGRFSTLLRHPLLTEALKNPSMRKSLGL